MWGSNLKKVLLAGITAAGVGLMTSPASAADSVKLEFGGSFNQAYLSTIDGQQFGNERNAGGFFFNNTDARPLSVNIDFGSFAVGGMFQFSQNSDGGPADLDRWVAGIGAGYTIDAWSVGLQYSHLDQSGDNSSSVEQFQQDRVMLTGTYALTPGINLGGEVGYSRIDADPEGAV